MPSETRTINIGSAALSDSRCSRTSPVFLFLAAEEISFSFASTRRSVCNPSPSFSFLWPVHSGKAKDLGLSCRGRWGPEETRSEGQETHEPEPDLKRIDWISSLIPFPEADSKSISIIHCTELRAWPATAQRSIFSEPYQMSSARQPQPSLWYSESAS